MADIFENSCLFDLEECETCQYIYIYKYNNTVYMKNAKRTNIYIYIYQYNNTVFMKNAKRTNIYIYIPIQ